jgi:hypothetical protein
LPALAQEESTFEWRGEIQPGQTIEVRNINGSIRAEAALGTQVEIVARKRGSYVDLERVRVEVAAFDFRILVCAVYPGFSWPERCTPEMQISLYGRVDVTVDITVWVPAGIAFKGRTVNGNVESDLPESPADLRTVNGRIVLSTNTAAQARTVNGSILASFGKVAWTGECELRTVNGAIDVELPQEPDLTVRGSTVIGMIGTDFPLPVQGGIIWKWIDGTIGRGGPTLVLSTVNGSLHLRRAPAPAIN